MIVQRANRYQREWQHSNHAHLCYSDNNTYVGVRTTGGATRSRYWPYRLAGTCRLQTFSLGYWFSRKSCATNNAMCQRRAGASGERKHPQTTVHTRRMVLANSSVLYAIASINATTSQVHPRRQVRVQGFVSRYSQRMCSGSAAGETCFATVSVLAAVKVDATHRFT